MGTYMALSAFEQENILTNYATRSHFLAYFDK